MPDIQLRAVKTEFFSAPRYMSPQRTTLPGRHPCPMRSRRVANRILPQRSEHRRESTIGYSTWPLPGTLNVAPTATTGCSKVTVIQ